MNPSFVVADEPTSMLDVSIRISIMELMAGLAHEFSVSYLHHPRPRGRALHVRPDRGDVPRQDRRDGPTEEILARPKHPYTKALLSAVPVPDPSIKRTPGLIKGGISKAINPTAGAASSSAARTPPRCAGRIRTRRSRRRPPKHFVACYRADEIEELAAAAGGGEA